MIRPDDIRKLLQVERFEALRIGLTDGRSILVRHPDQVVVAERHLSVGLAKMERSEPLATPRNGEAIAKDWMIINLLQITATELVNGATRGHRTDRPGRK